MITASEMMAGAGAGSRPVRRLDMLGPTSPTGGLESARRMIFDVDVAGTGLYFVESAD